VLDENAKLRQEIEQLKAQVETQSRPGERRQPIGPICPIVLCGLRLIRIAPTIGEDSLELRIHRSRRAVGSLAF
jgi:hypothetical protein